MNESCENAGLLRFGTFELNLGNGELRKSGGLIKLQSQHFQLLALLAQRGGAIVSREEIRRALWNNQTFVDFDGNINFSINQIRSALGDTPQRPVFIETVPRKGYRFIAPLLESSNRIAATRTLSDAGVTPNSSPQEIFLRDTRKTGAVSAAPFALWFPFAVAAVTLIGITVTAKLIPFREPRARPIASLAVLPLENLSHDPEQEYFADGMTDNLITDLAKIHALRVISRTSVEQYKGTKKPVGQIARELNVDALLEGTVMRDRDRVRITAQVIRASPEQHIWADKFEGSLREVLVLQDAVAKTVAQKIQVELTRQEQTGFAGHRSIDPDAYEAYLKGRHLWEMSGELNLERSREYFEQSIDKDPGYAIAWAGLADTYNYLASWGVLASQEARPRALAAARKALELDNRLVDPLIAIAGVKMNYEWDWGGAERLFRQAIALNSQSGLAHHEYATLLAELGRTQEALEEAQKARDVEPLSDTYSDNVVWKLYLAHRYREAEVEWHKQFGWNLHGDYILASAYLASGREQEGIAELRKGATLPWAGALELAYLGNGLGVTGDHAEGQKVLRQMLDLTRRRYIPPEYIALVYEGLGERDQALQWFEKAFAERSMNSWMLPDPRLNSIRADPRFQKILRRMGLPG